MQSTVKDTYLTLQGRLMFLAFLFVTVLSVGVMALESYNLVANNETLHLLINILSVLLGIMYSQIAMLIVEVVFQDELDQLPLISYLARLAPDLSIQQRFVFLTIIFKRQVTSLVSLYVMWIVVGATHRSAPIVLMMTMITAFTLYGIYHMERLAQLNPAEDDTADNLTERVIADER